MNADLAHAQMQQQQQLQQVQQVFAQNPPIMAPKQASLVSPPTNTYYPIILQQQLS